MRPASSSDARNGIVRRGSTNAGTPAAVTAGVGWVAGDPATGPVVGAGPVAVAGPTADVGGAGLQAVRATTKVAAHPRRRGKVRRIGADGMPSESGQQMVRVGVDVGGTFTDLVAWDAATGRLDVVKVPSTPPDFHRAVLDAVARGTGGNGAGGNGPAGRPAAVVHGSTVATNALLQRAGEPVAFVTTDGFRDLLLIGRQNRPELYALHVVRPPPITPEQNWFTVRERVDAAGGVVAPLDDGDVARLVRDVQRRGLRHAAVCLLFSFVNPDHERRVAAALRAAGVTVSLSSDVLPEFREYERASTTAINASLGPTVAAYLRLLAEGLGVGRPAVGVEDATADAPRPTPNAPPSLAIMHSGGGTLSPADAAARAAKLVLSGPAGGVIGAAFVAAAAGFPDAITYDMGGTSTDVAVVLGGQPQWSTGGVVDGLPIGLPAFDIHTVGAGGGSVARVDAGGALRVGPQSAGATPGPACYGRGGLDPTVTDADVVLGRIPADRFLGGGMTIEIDRAVRAVQPLADRMGKSPHRRRPGHREGGRGEHGRGRAGRHQPAGARPAAVRPGQLRRGRRAARVQRGGGPGRAAGASSRRTAVCSARSAWSSPRPWPTSAAPSSTWPTRSTTPAWPPSSSRLTGRPPSSCPTAGPSGSPTCGSRASRTS